MPLEERDIQFETFPRAGAGRILRSMTSSVALSRDGFEASGYDAVLSGRTVPAGVARPIHRDSAGAEQATHEDHDAVNNSRFSTLVSNDLAQAVLALGGELASKDSVKFRVWVEGKSRKLSPVLQYEVWRIACDVLQNAFRYARAREVEAEIRYDARLLRLRIRHDGKGIDHLEEDAEHRWLPRIRESVNRIGARFDLWSGSGAGSEAELTVPASVAYATHVRPRFELFRKWTGTSEHRSLPNLGS